MQCNFFSVLIFCSGVKRSLQAGPGAPQGNPPKKSKSDAPGLAVSRVVLVSGTPGSDDHEIMSNIRLAMYNSSLRVGRSQYTLNLTVHTSDKEYR